MSDNNNNNNNNNNIRIRLESLTLNQEETHPIPTFNSLTISPEKKRFYFFFPHKGKNISYYNQTDPAAISKFILESEEDREIRSLSFSDLGSPCILYTKGRGSFDEHNYTYQSALSFLYREDLSSYNYDWKSYYSRPNRYKEDNVWEYLTGCHVEMFPIGNVVLETDETLGNMLIKVINECDLDKAILPEM